VEMGIRRGGGGDGDQEGRRRRRGSRGGGGVGDSRSGESGDWDKLGLAHLVRAGRIGADIFVGLAHSARRPSGRTETRVTNGMGGGGIWNTLLLFK
jgi:hypothetical protein